MIRLYASQFFNPDFSTIISDFEMSDEDPHNSNHRREKKSKLFRPHEITDGKLGSKRLSGWLNHSISINLNLCKVRSTFTHNKVCFTERGYKVSVSRFFWCSEVVLMPNFVASLCHITITSLESFDTNFIIESNYWLIQLINST